MSFTELPEEGLAAQMADRAAEWPEGCGFAWYIQDVGDNTYTGSERELDLVCGLDQLCYGLYPPDPITLRDGARAEWFFNHGSPDLMLAIASGSEPWVASEALNKALRVSEERYLADMSAPPGSEAREELVSRMGQVLPGVIRSLRARRVHPQLVYA